MAAIADKTFCAIEEINREETPQDIVDTVSSILSEFGFDSFIVTGLPLPSYSIEPLILLSGWREEWYDRYVNKDYVHNDPVARYCFHTTEPFIWSDTPYDPEIDVAGHRIMREASDVGMPDGFCIPIHTEEGLSGCVSMSSEEFNLTPDERLLVHMISLYAHGRMRFLHGSNEVVMKTPLTSRQIEILKWAAEGRTNQDIADILGISHRTIIFHIQRVAELMGTINRTHTIVETYRRGLIPL